MFVDVVGKERQDMGDSKSETRVGIDSKYNIEEVELAVKIAKALLHYDPAIPPEEIAILTPYSAQKSKLLDRIKYESEHLHSIKVASITESQGDEYGYVIPSTVHSQPLEEIKNIQADNLWMRQNLGFVTDRHQINVGITRSKYGLIVTGNKVLLKYDATWEKLLKHYKEKDCVVSVEVFQGQNFK